MEINKIPNSFYTKTALSSPFWTCVIELFKLNMGMCIEFISLKFHLTYWAHYSSLWNDFYILTSEDVVPLSFILTNPVILKSVPSFKLLAKVLKRTDQE